MPETVITIDGAKELEKKLRDLGAQAEKKVYRQALRAGAKVVQVAAKAKAPKDTGLLRKSIKVRAGKRSRGQIEVNVCVDPIAFYWRFFEEGFYRGKRMGGRKMRQEANGRPWVPPRPFIRPAWDEQKSNALRIITDKLLSGIQAEAMKKA